MKLEDLKNFLDPVYN